MSVLTDVSDMFGPDGIYSNSLRHGDEWERVASIELLFPDGRDGFQVNCGIRILGGASRQPGKTPKHSFRIAFRGIYGPTKLESRLYPDSQVTRFDTVILRADFGNTWLHPSRRGRTRAQYSRDQWARDTQLAMGRLSSHGTFVHVYVNGLYWGLYNLIERPNAEFVSSYLGGEEEEYDVLNSGEAIDGNRASWNTMMSLANDGLSRDDDYLAIQEYLDVPNLIDYMLLNFYAGTKDWPFHNWFVARKREPGEQYRFYSWDAEASFEFVTENRTRVDDEDSPGRLYSQLRENDEFRLLFADHVHKHFFNGGVLTPESARARWMARADAIDQAVIAESARWGDYRRDVHSFEEGPYELYTRNDHWVPEQNRLLTDFFPRRTEIVLNQLRAADLYPDVGAPVFNRHGGDIAPGFVLTMALPPGTGGEIYYTLDRSDPRRFGSGTISGTANLYRGGVVLSEYTVVNARVLSDGTWSALNRAVFSVPTPLDALRISEIMYNPLDGKEAEFLELHNPGTQTLDLSGAAFTDGIGFIFPPESSLGPGDFLVLVSNPSVFRELFPDVPVGGVYSGNLENDGERVELDDVDGNTILSVDYDSEGFWPLGADGFGYSLVLEDASGDPDDPRSWRVSADVDGSPGAEDPRPLHGGVLINEILTRTSLPFEDAIELFNTTGADIDIGGWHLSDSRDNEESLQKFRIPPGTLIKAGGFLVFYEAQFNSGRRAFALSSRGDGVYLSAADGDGDLTGYIVGHEFRAAESGVSFGRYVTSRSQDFTAMSRRTFGVDSPSSVAQFRTGTGAPNTQAKVGPVVINELLYHAPVPDDEFVELHNLTDADVSLFDAPSGKGWQISGVQNEDGSDDFEMGPGAVIPARGYLLVVGIDPEEFRRLHGGLNGVNIVGPFTGSLDNSGERIRLSRPNPTDSGQSYIVVDQVRYNDKLPWPPEADGEGPSLERIAAAEYGNDPVNWGISLTAGGSPGVSNDPSPTAGGPGANPGGATGGGVPGAPGGGGGGSGGGGCALVGGSSAATTPLAWILPYALLVVGYLRRRVTKRPTDKDAAE